MTEDRGQMTEDREQRAEDRGQRAKDRGRRAAIYDLRFAIVDCRFYFMALHLPGVLCLYVGLGGVLFAGFKRQRLGELNGNSSQKAIYVINPTNMC